MFGDSNEIIIIMHGKEQYRLRITRLNKLILTK
ncbi:hemin uptake protein HemP [Cardiobacterium sp. AH-315-I02]|nr:hemin uptake protein HemP [Cardiobacterium sp. AH-315-I02]